MILTACDSRYLEEASFLIKSCARHEPNQQFYLFLVNDEETPDQVIHTWHPKIQVERVTWPYDQDRWRGIMCSARSVPIEQVLITYGEKLVYLDSDILIRGRLTKLFGELDSHDLLIKYRPDISHVGVAGTPHASKFNSGVIALRPSEEGIQFARLYNQLLRDHLDSGRPIIVYREEYKVDTYADQELLYIAYDQLKSILKFNPLPDKFNDAKFKPDSVIWHGKGTARQHPLYVLEKSSYRYPILKSMLPLMRSTLYTLRRFRRFMRNK